MNNILKKICGMLKNSDPARQCGAALVLAELAPKDARVAKELGEALRNAGDGLSAGILDALASIGSPDSFQYAMPLLHSENDEVRKRALAVAAGAGAGVAPEIRKRLGQASRREKLVYADLLARVPKPATYDILLEMLPEADFDLAREACDAVRRHVGKASPEQRLALHKLVVRFTNSAAARQRDRVLTSCLLLLGHIGRKEAATVLLKYAAPAKSPPDPAKFHLLRDPNYVRRHALIALKEIECSGNASRILLKGALPYLDDPDEEIARHALGVVMRLPASCIPSCEWRKLLKNAHSPVRAFAARKMAESDTAEANRILVSLLASDDNEVRDVAAGALAGRPKALPLLLQAFAAAKDADSAWTLARILKPHSETMDKKTAGKIKELAVRDMLAGNPRHEPFLYFLRNVAPRIQETVLLEVGLEHKKAKRWKPAIECLRRLLHTETFDADASYALFVCDLKASLKKFEPQFRAEDHALRGLQALIRQGPDPILKRLTADRALDAADLHYAGFHFCEGSTEHHEFGKQLLIAVVRKWPKSQEAKAVRERLNIGKATARQAAAAKPPNRRRNGTHKKCSAKNGPT